MQKGCFDLADLLTASGEAMGRSNQRLLVSGAPALLRQFELELRFHARFCLPPAGTTVLFDRCAKPSAQLQALTKTDNRNVTIRATYIAAPSLQPVPPT